MTRHDLRLAWQALRETGGANADPELRLRLYLARHGLRIFAATEAAGSRVTFVVELPRDLAPLELTRSRFRHVSVRVAEFPGLSDSRAAIVVTLLDAEFESLFESFATDIADVVDRAANQGAAVAGVVRTVDRWRRFLEHRTAPLSENEVRGLIGELAVLERASRKYGATVALNAWKAPTGSIRDFEFPDATVEVKTFTPSEGARVRISDPLQLEPDHGVHLFLACQELSRSEDQAGTLAGHIARVSNAFKSSPDLQVDFGNSMASSGYLEMQGPLYTQGYALGKVRVFRVDAGFPRVPPASIAAGVLDLRYSLSVSALGAYECDPESTIGSESEVDE